MVSGSASKQRGELERVRVKGWSKAGSRDVPSGFERVRSESARLRSESVIGVAMVCTMRLVEIQTLKKRWRSDLSAIVRSSKITREQ